MVITAYTEIMRDRLSAEDELQKNIVQVLNAANKAASLTYQLLAFSRKQVLAPLIIDLNNVVEDTSKMIHRLIGEDIELNVLLSEALWQVKADQGQIVQVLMNLCVNARDAMRDGGELRIETKMSPSMQKPRVVTLRLFRRLRCVVVSDNGTGMTKEVQSTFSIHSSPPRNWEEEPGSGYQPCMASSSKAEDTFGSIPKSVVAVLSASIFLPLMRP